MELVAEQILNWSLKMGKNKKLKDVADFGSGSGERLFAIAFNS